MTCPRCNGLIIDAWDDAHCVNCGNRQVKVEVFVQEEPPVKTCIKCSRPAITNQHCRAHRDEWRLYMTTYKIRRDVKVRGFAAVVAELDAKVSRLQELKRWMLTNRQVLSA